MACSGGLRHFRETCSIKRSAARSREMGTFKQLTPLFWIYPLAITTNTSVCFHADLFHSWSNCQYQFFKLFQCASITTEGWGPRKAGLKPTPLFGILDKSLNPPLLQVSCKPSEDRKLPTVSECNLPWIPFPNWKQSGLHPYQSPKCGHHTKDQYNKSSWRTTQGRKFCETLSVAFWLQKCKLYTIKYLKTL